MTIRKGEPWGEPAESPPDLQVSADRPDAREWVVWHRDGGPIDALARCRRRRPGAHLGGGARAGSPVPSRCRVDIVRVDARRADTTWGVAHVVARRSWLRGEVVTWR